ncbi:MAG: ABC transporter permease [Thermoanaerobacteraceae bacterium]|jgi:ABC-2 type transport system permease protein|nr:ABC transporter permease [Thermoanaerobacteraceae bacterium]
MRLMRLWAIVKKEVLHIRRDRPSLVISFLLPVMMLFLFGYAVTMDVDEIRTAVLDGDRTRASRELASAFAASGYFKLTAYPVSRQELERLITSGRVKAGLIIPAGYGRTLARGEAAPVQFIVDGSDPTTARTALQAGELVARVHSSKLMLAALDRSGKTVPLTAGVDFRSRVWYNPNMESARFFIPGLIGLIMQNITAMLTAFALVRERERGTLEQLIVTPVRPAELVIGKLIPYVVIAFIDVSLIFLVGTFWFGVGVAGNVLLLAVLALFFLLGALGLGLLISTVTRTQLQAMQATMGLILPSVLLSGFVFPREAMPLVIRWLGNFIPLTYFLEVLRGVILKGAGLDLLLTQAVVLVAFGCGTLLLAALRFRKTLD